MTYGEYWVAIKLSMKMIDGQWIVEKPLNTIPKQMNKKDASDYYNNKIREFWDSQGLIAPLDEIFADEEYLANL